MGTVTAGARPAVPAGDRSVAGMGPTAVSALPPGTAVVVVESTPLPPPVVCDVLAAFEELADGEELQAARPSAPAAARATRGESPAMRNGEGHGPRR